MSTLALLLGAVAALSPALTLATTATALAVLGRARRRPAPDLPGPAILVLKPLKGADPDLYDDLAAFARQDHPRFELVQGTADPHDPALEIAHRLAKDFPRVTIRVVTGAHELAGEPCVVGKSMLFRRSELEPLGGWRSVRDVLAEDYSLGKVFQRAGWRVAPCAHPLPILDRRRTVRAFLARHLRWAQMRCRIAPWAYGGELLLAPSPWLLAFAAAAWEAGAAAGGAAFAAGDALPELSYRSFAETPEAT